MTQLISFPFRLATNGSVATVEDGTDDYYTEQLAVLVLTRPGERELVPDFGITDPVFSTFNTGELVAKVAMFGPPVRITNVKSTYPRPDANSVVIEFDNDFGAEEFVPSGNSADTLDSYGA